MTTKREVELSQINATREKMVALFSLIGTLSRVVGAVFVVKVIMDGLEHIVLSKPENISALAQVAKAVNPENITGYILAIGAGIAWKRERAGKKRAIKKYSAIQKKYEPGDSSSGLTETGDTPDEE